MKRFILIIATLAMLAGVADAARYSAQREGLNKCVVRVGVGGSFRGSGTVVDNDGYTVILTALHVVDSPGNVFLSDGSTKINAEIIGKDTANDIAVLAAENINSLDVIAAKMLERPARVGESINHTGYGGSRFARTVGYVISCRNNRIAGTCEVISGDSGSPVFIDGKIAGIVTNSTRIADNSRRFFRQTKPAFIGTASIIIMAIMNAKPIIEKIVALYKKWKKVREFFRRRCNPEPEPIITEPEPEPETITPEVKPLPVVIVAPNPLPVSPIVLPPEVKPESSGISPAWIAAGPGGALISILTFLGACALGLIKRS